MSRGALVTIAPQGACGKPRPALVVQSDPFAGHPSVTILPVTSELRETPLFRVEIKTTAENGLEHLSQVMIDKIQTVPRAKVGDLFGRVDDKTMLAVNRAFAIWLGFA